MSEQLQLRRGTSSQVAAFTGAQGELAIDTTNNIPHVNDGATAGGWALALATRTAVSDAAYAALVTDRLIAYIALTAARVVTLPSAASYPTGAILLVVDESGNCSATKTITVNRAASDTIDGATSAAVAGAYGVLALESNGSNAWTIVHSRSPATARTPVSDAAYSALATDRMIAYTALTAARIISLPAAAAYPTGTQLVIVDESGSCSPTNTISVSRAGSDTINGATSAVIAMPRGYLALESNGVSAWTIVYLSAPAVPSPNGASAQLEYIEQLITCSGATANVPLGVTAILLAVSLRVVATVTGCTSITVNDSQNGNGHWGSSIALTAGTTNAGVASPGAYYNGTTTLALAAVGGGASFTGGAVRVSALVMLVNPPAS